jgi:hypothetical protein
LQPTLTPEDVEHLRSLSDYELLDFLDQLPDDEAAAVCALMDSEAARSPGLASNYASDRSARNAEVINAKTAAAQEIGPLPDVANPQRRERCTADNLLFAETYFGPTFYRGWAPYQREMMDSFQEVILNGGKKVRAVRRGGLKSTCARASVVWATMNGHSNFTVLVGASESQANDHRKNFFDLMVSSATLLEDYPELMPLAQKWKQPKRQFRLDGRLLEMTHKDEKGRIVFPDIHGAKFCQAHVAPYSINSTDPSGLSFVDRFGVTQRPKVIAFDDVQTPQSSRSPLMTEEREEIIDRTYGGLYGLGEKSSAIMVCTVRNHDDLTERYLDRKKHPDWDGKTFPSVIRMPDAMDMWDRYGAMLFAGATPEDGLATAQDFYVANRAAMDAGAVVAWEDDKLDGEVSAIQSMMTVRAIKPEYFRCEIQQEGAVPVNTSGISLNAQDLLTRLSHVERGTVPEGASYTTAFIDSSDQVLWWMVCGWAKDFSGWLVDYGTWPDQGRAVFYKSDLAATISQQLPGASWEEAFVYAHNNLELELTTRFPSLDLILKDWSDGGQKPRIESQVMASPNRTRIRPYKGFAPSPGKKPVHLWGDPIKDRHTGGEWIERRSENPIHVQANANIWKSHAARRLLTTPGAPSSLLLPGDDERANRLLVEHLTAERPVRVSRDGTDGIKWELLPARDNDWWDCLYGNGIAASMLGCTLSGEVSVGTKQRRSFSLPGGNRG